tara:strand:- start:173 stop:577 length:405 start_codon:yes stop_codon:yes gene_type:complete
MDATLGAKGKKGTKGMHSLQLSHCANRGYGPSGQAMWPTPSALDGKGSGQTGQTRDRLDYAVERGATKNKLYPSPDVGMAKGRGEASAEKRHRLGGSLNPTWVEWLMGFPLGWTDLNASATPSSPKLSNSSDAP